MLLLPSADPEESVRVLRQRSLAERGGHNWVLDGNDLLDDWVRSDLNRALADAIVFVDGRAPRDVADEIVMRFELSS